MQFSKADSAPIQAVESPHHVRVSLAAAMTLGFVPGWFYRNARLRLYQPAADVRGGMQGQLRFLWSRGREESDTLQE